MNKDLSIHIAKEVLKSCNEQLQKLNNANKKIRTYLLENEIDNKTRLQLKYALDKIYSDAKWLSQYSKNIREKYHYYD